MLEDVDSNSKLELLLADIEPAQDVNSLKFNEDEITAFVDKISKADTVKRLVSAIDIDELNNCLFNIDKFYNNGLTFNLILESIISTKSSMAIDYFKQSLEGCEIGKGQGITLKVL
jgi:hypothetical protein